MVKEMENNIRTELTPQKDNGEFVLSNCLYIRDSAAELERWHLFMPDSYEIWATWSWLFSVMIEKADSVEDGPN